MSSRPAWDLTTVGAVFNRDFSVWVAVKNRSHRIHGNPAYGLMGLTIALIHRPTYTLQ